MRMLILLLFSSVSTSYSQERISSQDLQHALNGTMMTVDYSVQTVNMFTIKSPKNLKPVYQKIIKEQIIQDRKLDVCDDAEVSISYDVQQYNEHLLSIKKLSSIFNCYATAMDMVEYQNYFIKGGSLYSLNYNGADLGAVFLNEGAIADCQENENKIEAQIYFRKGKINLNIFRDKLCTADFILDADLKYIEVTQLSYLGINTQNQINQMIGLWELVKMDEEGAYTGTGMLWHFKDDGSCSIEENSSLSSVDNYNYSRSNANCSTTLTSNNDLEYLKIIHKTDSDDQRCYQIVSLRIVDQKKHLTLYSHGSVQPFVLVQRD